MAIEMCWMPTDWMISERVVNGYRAYYKKWWPWGRKPIKEWVSV
jgi:hypothetical protein